ncbi:MAG TPA: hypothetical protein VIC71_05890 [Gammaproteobacteria bacterium]|jgi:hypothetical protein
MQNSNDGGDAPAREDSSAGDPEAWGIWETGLLLGSIAVGTTGLVVIGWAVEQFILS